MKRLLILLLGCYSAFEGSAQDTNIESYGNGAGNSFFVPLYKKPRNTPHTDTTELQQYLSALKGRKPGVYRLPQDNMPCIVPDTNKTVKIPNAWRGPVRVPYRSNPPRIPNLAKPWVPTPITNTTENENTNTR